MHISRLAKDRSPHASIPNAAERIIDDRVGAKNSGTRGAAALAVCTGWLAALSGCGGPDCDYPAPPADAGATSYVCAGSDGDGSESDPYGSLAQAVNEAVAGATILVAAGSYAENVMVRKPVRIVGSSDPASPDAAAARLEAPAPNALVVEGAQGVILQGLYVANPAGVGIWLKNGAQATVQGSRVEGATAPFGYGVLATESTVTLRSSAVAGSAGIGVYLVGSVAIIDDDKISGNLGGGVRAEQCPSVDVLHAEVDANTDFGVLYAGSVGIIDDDKITGTERNASTADGIIVTSANGVRSDVTVRASTIEGNGRAGILFAGDVVGIIDDDKITGNGFGVSDKGAGIAFQDGAGTSGALRLIASELTGNAFAGIAVFAGATASIEGNSIAGTEQPGTGIFPSPAPGDGIAVFDGASATVLNNMVSASFRAGLFVAAAAGSSTSVTGNTLSGNAFGVVLQEQGADPVTVDASNMLNGNTTDMQVISASMTALPRMTGSFALPGQHEVPGG